MAKNINNQFLDSYSKDFADKIISNLPEENSIVTGKEILSLTPSKQVNFFILKLLYGQWQDEMKKLESPYFNYKHPDVKKALTAYMNVLSQHIEVHQEHLKPLVEKSIHLTLSWLILPGLTLKDEVETKGIKQIAAIKGMSKYFKIYQDDLAYLISEKQEVTVQEFLEEWEQLMDQKSTDSTIVKELGDVSEIMEISISDLIEVEIEDTSNEESDMTEEDDMTIEVSEEPEVENESVEEDEIEEPEALEEEETDQLMDSSTDEEEAPTETIENEELKNSEEEEPEKSDLTQEDHVEEERVELDDSLNQKFAKSEETLHDQYKEEQVSVAAKHQQKKISSILEAVSVNQEYMFTTELFGGEKDLFLEAIEKIESCSSFDESVEILVSSYSKDYSWDMNSVEVKELLKVVFRRFR